MPERLRGAFHDSLQHEAKRARADFEMADETEPDSEPASTNAIAAVSINNLIYNSVVGLEWRTKHNPPK